MGVKIDVALRSLDSERRAILIVVLKYVRRIVGHADAYRHAATIVSGADIPGMGRLALQRRVIGTAGDAIGLRSGVAVVRRDAERLQDAGQIRQPLLIGDLEAPQPSA